MRFRARYTLRGNWGFISYRMPKAYIDFAEQKYRVARQHIDKKENEMTSFFPAELAKDFDIVLNEIPKKLFITAPLGSRKKVLNMCCLTAQ